MKKNKRKKANRYIIEAVIIIICLFIGIFFRDDILDITKDETSISTSQTKTYIDINDIPEYTDKSYVEINNNIPYFEESEYITESFEKYSELDNLGRCGVAYANINKEIMPPKGDKRGSISSVKPTGWIQAKYDGEYLYNRCHLIGYQLSDEDANELNLITGTRYFNVEGMLPFENKVADYIEENENHHVLYRVTPVFEGDNLVASGVEIEAYSVEDKGEGVCYNVIVYNVQPSIEIDYVSGASTSNINT